MRKTGRKTVKIHRSKHWSQQFSIIKFQKIISSLKHVLHFSLMGKTVTLLLELTVQWERLMRTGNTQINSPSWDCSGGKGLALRENIGRWEGRGGSDF